ncbi:nucleocapsid protein [Mammarenavirus allpahuayoense]|uniref:Nucleoprotein n=1 Tax=Allpahuayo mammarenavirus (isolate Rat/Peru/CLHP-2472/1997) TaxID=144752 RepID=NCAP_ALLVP|nr:nucleocapsid protein [Mammarenavirus allpahuayoense]Q9DK04.1 RecName: Full=Nucleoprotein; AltName: Full=Nucleocapsid protein; AltName: Full=Protein N [Mammarenavirus allpahuayoense]AAG42532.1 nucleocapsid protein [Mammarenavirus allpahuayoense]
MSSENVPSFRWTQSLRRGLSNWTHAVKGDVLADARAIVSALDFHQVAQVQRMMRKDKRSEADLTRLRDMNKEVDALMMMRSAQKDNILKVGGLSKDELMELASDLDKLRKKVQRTEGGGQPGVYAGNLTSSQLNQRSEILKMMGMGTGPRGPVGGVVKVWDIKDSSLLVNQFGSMPALTIACMTQQGGEQMNDVVQALTSLGLVYTVKYPNLSDLEKLTEKHPCLKLITQEPAQINISGYNLSLSAAVKADACMIDGGNMLETLQVKPSMFSTLIKTILEVKNREGMFVSPSPGQRNPYENILYKVCLSGDGWPYIGSRSQIKGRAWENTTVDLEGKPSVNHPPVRNGGSPDLKQIPKTKEDEVIRAIEQLDPRGTTWVDIEGPPGDPVELALFQPETGNYLHCYRRPHNENAFKDQSKFSHGLLLKDLADTQPGLISCIIRHLPNNMVLTAQGNDDIIKLLEMHGRRDIKVLDVKLSSDQARLMEDVVWERYNMLCVKHTGLVIKKKKKGAAPGSANPHCALLDCIMFDATVTGYLRDQKPKRLLPLDTLYRDNANLINL